MNLRKPPRLSFRSQKSQERDDYIRDSLSSLAASSRLACLSSSRDLKTDPFPLKFHGEWRHDSCKVMKWYDQIAPSTQVTSIEHCKTLEAPFFHEFLLIHLTDGAWFPAENYATTPLGQRPSKAVIHVKFPRTFDLLNVLAICYSITQHCRASIYTLQRYNCYFFCNTIITILTRRVAEWETTLITPETWPKLVDDVLKELPRKKHNDAFDYFGIGICSLLEPDCPNLVNDVVELLRSEIKSGAYGNVVMGIADTLWYRDVQSSIMESLSGHVDTATNKASSDGDAGAIGLETLLDGGNGDLYPDTKLRDPMVQRALIKADLSCKARVVRQYYSDLYWVYKMKLIERGGGSSRSIELLASVIVPFANWWAYDMDVVRGVPGVGDKLDMRTRARFELGRILLALSFGKSGGLALLDDNFETAWDQTSDKKTHAEVLTNYELCRLPVIDTRSKTLGLLHCRVDRERWMYSIQYCLTRLLTEALSGSTGPGAIALLEPIQSDLTVVNIQDHVHRRIQQHAKRVEGYQLAAAQLVEEDLERGMGEIWKSLPNGFGGVKPQRPMPRVHRSTRPCSRILRRTTV